MCLSKTREKLFDLIDTSSRERQPSTAYDFFMFITILISLTPLCFKGTYPLLTVVETCTTIVFICDYLIRLFTADLKVKCGKYSFFIYPLTPMAIIDLLSILPFFISINQSLKLLRVFRMFRAVRVIRIFKLTRYSRSISIILNIFKKERVTFSAVGTFAVCYIIFSALLIYNVEPDTFQNLFEAIYWATVSLTTVGYGDLYPVTTIGRFISMISSVFGIAVIALPASIITTGYMTEVSSKNSETKKN